MSTISEKSVLRVGVEKQLLVIDADQHAQDSLVTYFRNLGFDAFGVANCDEAFSVIESRGLPHLALLTIATVDQSMFLKGQLLSRNGDLPIIVLSQIDDIDTVTRAIIEFADDYVRMPCVEAELLARVRRVLLRTTQPSTVMRELRERIDDNFYINFDNGDTFVDEQHALLTPIEVKIMKTLNDRSGQIVPYDAVTMAVWGDDNAQLRNSLWVHIRRLRKKIEFDPRRPQRLLTIRGTGYCLCRSGSESTMLAVAEVRAAAPASSRV